MAYEKPNHTQIPNLFLDEHLSEITSLAELKVTLVILRRTIGWHEKEVKLDISEIIGLTGMSRQSVVDGLALAVKRGTVKRRRLGHGFIYEPNFVRVQKVDSLRVKNFAQKVDSSKEEALYVLKKERKVKITGKKTYRKPTESLPPKTPPPPYYDEPFLDQLNTFARYRKKLKRPLEDEAAVEFYADLAALGSSERAIAEMKRAMAKGWLGVFPEKHAGNGHSNGNGKLPAVKITTAEDIERMMRPT